MHRVSLPALLNRVEKYSQIHPACNRGLQFGEPAETPLSAKDWSHCLVVCVYLWILAPSLRSGAKHADSRRFKQSLDTVKKSDETIQIGEEQDNAIVASEPENKPGRKKGQEPVRDDAFKMQHQRSMRNRTNSASNSIAHTSQFVQDRFVHT